MDVMVYLPAGTYVGEVRTLYYWSEGTKDTGLLAILAKSIAIAIAILVGNSIAILSAILYFIANLRYDTQ